MNSYLRGLVKRAAIEKSAKNILRLLSRVGPDLAGASSRDLKFLNRRGLMGFNPETVASMRSNGFLPSVDAELAGFNRGTENMFRFAPKPKAGNAFRINTSDPIHSIVRTNEPGANYHADLTGRTALIPDTSVGKSLAERERLATIARHEAREWVRGNAALARGNTPVLPGHTGDLGDLLTVPEVGSSHMPGVIYDERLFRSGLSNRLGLGKRWDELPIVVRKGKPIHRGPRDAYVGNQDLPYEFSRIREWNKLRQSQYHDALNRVGVESRRLDDPVVRGKAESIVDAALKKYRQAVPTPSGLPDNAYMSKEYPEFWNDWDMTRVLYNGGPKSWRYDITSASGGPWKKPELLQYYADAIRMIGLNSASRATGIPRDELLKIITRQHVYAAPGSELRKVMDLPIA